MELETEHSCGRCQYRVKMKEKSETSNRITHVKTSRQCSHKSNSDAYETIDGRIEYHGSGKDSGHEIQRTRFTSKCSESSDKFQLRDNRCSGKKHSRQNQSTSFRSSSTESGCRSDDSFFMKSNSMLRCSQSTPDELKNQNCKRNVVCTCHSSVHASNSMIHKHKCSHCSQRVKRPCHGLHSHDDKGRQHEHYLCALGAGTSMDGMENGSPCCKHRHCCHCQDSASSHNFFHRSPCENTGFSLSTIGTQKQAISTMRGPINLGYFPLPDYSVHGLNVRCVEHVNTPFGYESGLRNMSGRKNGLMSSCIISNSNMINQEAEKQKHWDESPKLSLKTSRGTKLKVEGCSKHDLKLSLPNAKERFDVRNHLNSIESPIEEVKQVGHSVCSTHHSCIYHRNRRLEKDPSLCNQQREKLNCFEVQHTITSMPDLNLPPNTTDVYSGVNVPTNISLDSCCDCFNAHTKEPPHSAVLNQMSTQGHSDYKDNCFDRPAVLPDQRMAGSINHTSILCNGIFKDSLLRDANSKATHICGAPEYKYFNNESVHFSGINELLSDPIVNDSEDKCSKQNTIQSLHGQHIAVGICDKGSAPEEILANHETRRPSQGNNMRGTLRPGNMVWTASKDKMDNDINLMLPHSAQSPECSAQRSALDARWTADNCSIVEISSSEDECVDNNTLANKLQSNGTLMEDSGTHTPHENLAVKVLENDTMDKENIVCSRGVDNHEAAHNVEGGSLRTSRSQETKLPCEILSPQNDGGIPTVWSRKEKLSSLEQNLIDPQLGSSEHNIHDPECAEAERKLQIWNNRVICDLCGQGPSLMYGEWYAWCCGLHSHYCKCTEEHKRKLLKSMAGRAKSSIKWKGYQWSGKVHRMCGLWSSKVFEKDDTRYQLEGLLDAVRTARFFVCAECKRFGATLGCGGNKCKKIFHYPCADWLSTKLHCKMWEGFKHPVSCYQHRHVDDYCLTPKDRKIHPYMKYSNDLENAAKWKKNAPTHLDKTIRKDIINSKIKVKDDPDMKNQVVIKAIFNNVDDAAVSPDLSSFLKNRTGVSTESNKRLNDHNCDRRQFTNYKATLYRKDHGGVNYLGQNLICEDISNGAEMIKIPCTNDIDNVSIPKFQYILKNRFSTITTIIIEDVQSNMEKKAKACDGCDEFDMDDPEAIKAIHVQRNECSQDQDDRVDWQGEPMLGRLAYDCYGRLQLGPRTDVVECNSKCPCGSQCLNRELQYGLRVGLEVFRTKERGWGVRALEQIPRGKFVVEYVGEILSQDEATEREKMDDTYNSRYLFAMDHPAVSYEDQFVVDIFGMSNVARFINHSSAGNLSIYRVYTEILDHRIYRLGMYACRDIEVGEEITYDYKVGEGITYDYKIPTKEPGASTESSPAVKRVSRPKRCRH